MEVRRLYPRFALSAVDSLMAANRIDEADRIFRRLIEIAPENGEVYFTINFNDKFQNNNIDEFSSLNAEKLSKDEITNLINMRLKNLL